MSEYYKPPKYYPTFPPTIPPTTAPPTTAPPTTAPPTTAPPTTAPPTTAPPTTAPPTTTPPTTAPPTTVPPTAPPCASEIFWVVEPGDTIYLIARETNTTVTRLLQLNPHINPNRLIPGTRICLPA